MKQFLIFSFLCVLCNPLFAQITGPNKTLAYNNDISEKLVTLALQNPELEIADHQINIAKYNVVEAKAWWADRLSVSFNANEFTIKRLENKQQPNGQFYPYYPFYNVGLQLTLGDFFSKPATTRAAKEQVAIAEAKRTSTYRSIRAAVLTAYENYLANQELLTIQSQVTESLYNDYLQAKEKFRNGSISVDDYNKAIQAYHDQLAGRINAEHNFNLTKIQLEALIGVPIETVLNNGSMGNTGTVIDSTRAK